MFSQARIGLIVFNCLAYRKNSATERRVSQENASELHVVQEVPSLRVIGDGLWQRVKMRKGNWREARTERHPAGPGVQSAHVPRIGVISCTCAPIRSRTFSGTASRSGSDRHSLFTRSTVSTTALRTASFPAGVRDDRRP